MKTKYILAVLCLVLLGSNTIAQTGNEGAAVTWKTHYDSAYNLSMQYPSDWQLKPPSPNARFFVTSYKENEEDNFRENVNCIVPSPVEKSATIKAAAADIEKTLSGNLTDFKIVYSGYTQWNNVNAYQIKYTCTQESGGETYYLKMYQQVAIIKGKLYALTFTSLADSYDKYIATVERMFRSFKVK